MHEADPDDDLIPIGQFARAARVTVRTLRHYHMLGVLVPAWVDPGSGYRYYRRSQLADMVSVRLLRELDVSLEDIRAYRDGRRTFRSILEAERSRLAAEAARAGARMAMIDHLVGTAGLPESEPEVLDLEPVATLCLTGEVEADTLLTGAGQLVDRLVSSARGLGVDTSPPVIGEYPASLEGTLTIRMHLPLDDPDAVGQGAIDPDAAEPESVGRGAAVERSSFPGGRYGRLVHTGPLESLPLAYHQLLGWLHSGNHPVRGPFFERYLDDPWLSDPADLRTEVLHPVQPTPEPA